MGTILGCKIGSKGSQDMCKRGPRRRQEGQKRKAASPRRPETRPDADFLAIVPRLGLVLEAKIDLNRSKLEMHSNIHLTFDPYFL